MLEKKQELYNAIIKTCMESGATPELAAEVVTQLLHGMLLSLGSAGIVAEGESSSMDITITTTNAPVSETKH